jgi:hypothetical protein
MRALSRDGISYKCVRQSSCFDADAQWFRPLRDKERSLFITLIAIFLIASCSLSAGARSHGSIEKAQIHFLATSTVIRGTWGTNEDVYLAELRLSSNGESTLVRLIDEYSSDFPPLSTKALTSPAGTVLRVRRDVQCDVPYGAMLLRTAAGDPTAILSDRLGYDPKLSSVPASHMILRCYRTVRK